MVSDIKFANKRFISGKMDSSLISMTNQRDLEKFIENYSPFQKAKLIIQIKDERGFFMRVYDTQLFEKYKIHKNWRKYEITSSYI